MSLASDDTYQCVCGCPREQCIECERILRVNAGLPVTRQPSAASVRRWNELGSLE